MEYIEGIDITQLKSHPELCGNIKHYFESLVFAINELHLLRIAHRDIKPENVIIQIDGQLKVIDFNISKKWKKTDQTHSPLSCNSEDSIDETSLNENESCNSHF